MYLLESSVSLEPVQNQFIDLSSTSSLSIIARISSLNLAIRLTMIFTRVAIISNIKRYLVILIFSQNVYDLYALEVERNVYYYYYYFFFFHYNGTIFLTYRHSRRFLLSASEFILRTSSLVPSCTSSVRAT